MSQDGQTSIEVHCPGDTPARDPCSMRKPMTPTAPPHPEVDPSRQVELLLAALGGVDDGVSLFDDGLRLTACNQRFLELLSLPAEFGRPGARLRDILAFQATRGDFGAGKEASVDYRIEHFWQPVERESERPYHGGRILRLRRRPIPGGGFLTIYTDVTAARMAAAALRASEQRLRDVEQQARTVSDRLAAAIGAMPYGVALYDRNECLVAWNEAYVGMHAALAHLFQIGTPFETLLRGTLAARAPDISPDEREAYVASRLRFHRDPKGSFERRLPNGAWQEILESQLADGSRLVIIHDVTARKEAETALRASEQRFRDFAEAASDWLWQWDVDQRFTYVSERVAEVLGEPVEFFIGKRREEFGVVEIDPLRDEAYQAALANRHPFQDFRYRLHLNNGRHVLVSTSGKPIFDAAGDFAGYRGTARDITRITLAEQAAERAQDRLVAAIEGLPQAIALYDAEDRLASWNQAFAATYKGHDHLVRIGIRFEDLIRGGIEGRLFAKAENFLERRMALHRAGKGTLEHRFADETWKETREHRLADGGRLVMVTDITERKRADEALRQSQQRLLTHLEHTPLGAVEFDVDHRIVSWNQAAERMFGFSRAEVLGRRPNELIIPPSSLLHVERVQDALRHSAGGARSTNENITKDGRLIVCDWYNTGIYDADGVLTGVASLVQDITDRIRAEAELRDAKEAAEISDRAKTEFLANMSHELRTPLNAIIGFSEVIGESMFGPVGTPRYVEYARDIHHSGVHLLQIINDLLDISKIEAGKLELHEEPVRIPETIERVQRLVGEAAERGGLRCFVAVPSDIPAVRADARALRQILLNLWSNAVKFTPAGGEIRVTARIDAAGAVVIAVSDTGIGIRAQDIPRALAPFSQIDSHLSRRYQGTGLGLPLAKRLIELHGGSLDLSSVPGSGTTVTVRLPPERTIG